MARPVTVHLRQLRKKEVAFLERKLREKTMSARVYERYRVIGLARHGLAAREVAERSGMHVTSVYDWVTWFNDHGFAAFEAPPNPAGRPSSLSGKQIREMIKIALSRPTDLGLPYTHWSISKLKEYLTSRGIFPDFSDEWVRRLLRREGVTFQHTKTWKESPDPEFEGGKTAF